VQTAELFMHRAEKYFKQATQVDPDSVASQRGYGKFLLKNNRLDEAENCFLRALELCSGQV
jgi:Tfp pilus assembly protein PilF